MKSSSRAILQGSRQFWLDRLRKEGYALDYGSYQRASAEVSYLFLKPKQWKEFVVLFHGTGNDLLFCWQALIERLLSEGRAVFCFDLDGHGTKSSTILDGDDFWTAPRDLADFFLRLAPGKDYSIVAYSLGALLALNAVSERILNPKRLALLALPSSIRLPLAFAFCESLSIAHPAFWRQTQRYGFAESFPAFGPVRRTAFPIRKQATEIRSYPEIVADLFRSRPPEPLLAKLNVPVLRLYGRWDFLAPAPQTTSRPGESLGVIDSSNHFLLPFLPETIERICQWMNT